MRPLKQLLAVLHTTSWKSGPYCLKWSAFEFEMKGKVNAAMLENTGT
jgi:hypothetical protein